MSRSRRQNDTYPRLPRKGFIDEFGNVHQLGEMLDQGGQGVVYRTTDDDLAIKQPLDTDNHPGRIASQRIRFQNLRLLPFPHRIPVSLPLATLRDEPGYVMRLLNGMKPFAILNLDGNTRSELKRDVENGDLILPEWLSQIPDPNKALQFLHYARTGSTRRRLLALSKCAAILARLHDAGLVYGDISPNNVFVGDDSPSEVWLIDVDNLRFELREDGRSTYTPRYGAPEVVQRRDQSRPRTDCWAFAVMAFETLALCHPFIGRKVLQPDNDNLGWDADPPADGVPADPFEQAYAGNLPYIDDNKDDSNAEFTPALPRELIATAKLRDLFQMTLGEGRTQPHHRPAMFFWALEMARAHDQSLACQECKMSYFADDLPSCPYCRTPRPPFARAKTNRWQVLIPTDTKEFALPHRMFNDFSLEHHDDTAHEVVLNFTEKTALPVRGTKAFPDDLVFEFEEAVQ